jgi:hypothetical protein
MSEIPVHLGRRPKSVSLSLIVLKADSIEKRTEFVQSTSKTEWDLADPQIRPREVFSPEKLQNSHRERTTPKCKPSMVRCSFIEIRNDRGTHAIVK